jgi:hypothetical protein
MGIGDVRTIGSMALDYAPARPSTTSCDKARAADYEAEQAENSDDAGGLMTHWSCFADFSSPAPRKLRLDRAASW